MAWLEAHFADAIAALHAEQVVELAPALDHPIQRQFDGAHHRRHQLACSGRQLDQAGQDGPECPMIFQVGSDSAQQILTTPLPLYVPLLIRPMMLRIP